MKVLLHTCCAPCSIMCINQLKLEGITPVVFWYNPNIHPFTEYEKRRKCLIDYTEKISVEYAEKYEYGLRDFISNIYPNYNDRCEYCYRKRLSETAKYASENGYDAFSTTLLISPYQNHEMIRKISTELEREYNVKFLYRDFRPYFIEGQNIARNIELYMQNYCGCIFSEEERYMYKIINEFEKKSPLKLLKPTTMFKNQIIKYREAFLSANERLDGCAGLEDCETYEEWINFSERLQKKYGSGYVPSTTYIVVRKSDNKLVGMVDFRHSLNEFLKKFGGNIGYSILPEERGKGYGTEVLRLIILKCKKFRKDKVLITCDKSNIASSKIILANGGILENEVKDECNLGISGVIQRYRIDIK